MGEELCFNGLVVELHFHGFAANLQGLSHTAAELVAFFVERVAHGFLATKIGSDLLADTFLCFVHSDVSDLADCTANTRADLIADLTTDLAAHLLAHGRTNGGSYHRHRRTDGTTDSAADGLTTHLPDGLTCHTADSSAEAFAHAGSFSAFTFGPSATEHPAEATARAASTADHTGQTTACTTDHAGQSAASSATCAADHAGQATSWAARTTEHVRDTATRTTACSSEHTRDATACSATRTTDHAGQATSWAARTTEHVRDTTTRTTACSSEHTRDATTSSATRAADHVGDAASGTTTCSTTSARHETAECLGWAAEIRADLVADAFGRFIHDDVTGLTDCATNGPAHFGTDLIADLSTDLTTHLLTDGRTNRRANHGHRRADGSTDCATDGLPTRLPDGLSCDTTNGGADALSQVLPDSRAFFFFWFFGHGYKK